MNLKKTLIAVCGLLSMSAHAQSNWYASAAYARSLDDSSAQLVQGSASTFPSAMYQGVPIFKLQDANQINLAIGRQLNPNIRIELQAVNRKNDFDTTIQKGVGSRINDQFKIGGNVKTTGLLMNAYYDFPNQTHWTPYLMVGAGMVRHKTEADIQASISAFGVPFGGPANPYPSNSRNNFSYSIGLGTSYKISEQLNLQLGITHNRQGDVYTGNDGFSDRVEIEIKSTEVNIGLRYDF